MATGSRWVDQDQPCASIEPRRARESLNVTLREGVPIASTQWSFDHHSEAKRASATGLSGNLFKSTTREETPTGRQKRGREGDPSREEVERQLHEASSITSAGRWILSQLAKLPVVGALISPVTSPKETGTSPNSERPALQNHDNDGPVSRQPICLSTPSLHKNRSEEKPKSSPQSGIDSNLNLLSQVFTEERRRQMLDSGMIENESGTPSRPMSAGERQMISDLPVYRSVEEQLEDLKYIIHVRSISTSMILWS